MSVAGAVHAVDRAEAWVTSSYTLTDVALVSFLAGTAFANATFSEYRGAATFLLSSLFIAVAFYAFNHYLGIETLAETAAEADGGESA